MLDVDLGTCILDITLTATLLTVKKQKLRSLHEVEWKGRKQM